MSGKELQLCLIVVILCFQGCDTVTRKQSFEQETILSAKLAGTWLSVDETISDVPGSTSEHLNAILVINKSGDVSLGMETYSGWFGDSIIDLFGESDVIHASGKIEGETMVLKLVDSQDEEDTAVFKIEYKNSLLRLVLEGAEQNAGPFIIFRKNK